MQGSCECIFVSKWMVSNGNPFYWRCIICGGRGCLPKAARVHGGGKHMTTTRLLTSMAMEVDRLLTLGVVDLGRLWWRGRWRWRRNVLVGGKAAKRHFEVE